MKQFREALAATAIPKHLPFPHADKSLLDLAKSLCTLFKSQSQAASSTPRQEAAAAQSILNDLERLIHKIKDSQPIFSDSLITGDPTLRDRVYSKETKVDDLGFSPLFYAAKYSTQKGTIACLLEQANSKERTNSLKALLNNNNNPYVGTRPLMICARFGSSHLLKEILAQFPDGERTNQVNFTVKKGRTKDGVRCSLLVITHFEQIGSMMKSLKGSIFF